MDDLYKLIVGLRALRDYEETPISDQHLNAILEAARWTGSSKNRQDWSFLVITDRDRLEGLAEHGDFTDPVRASAATIVLVMEPGGNMFDIGRAAQNIMLAARTQGVATCPITLHRDDDARRYLGLPGDTVSKYAVALGYPSRAAAPRKFGGRKEIRSVVRVDTAS